MTKIKVLHCLETIGSGGVEQLRLILAKNLDPKIYEQAIICTQAAGIIPEQLENVGCKVYSVGILNHLFDIKTHLNVLKVIKEFKPHIIHGAVFEGVTMASICGGLSRVPIIIGEETSDPTNRSPKATLLLKGLSVLTHKMVGVSPASYSYLVDTANINKDKVVLINNGVEPSIELSDEQKNSLRKELKIAPNSFVIGFVGRLLDSDKRVSDLIKAFASIVRSYPRAKLLIVGDGPDKAMLTELANNLGVVDKIIFTGYQSNTRPFYNIMDVFALPSLNEAFGLVLVEAMFANLPIVASRVGGIPSVVRDGVTGLLFEAKDIKGLEKHLLYIIEHPSEALQMGQRGYEVAVKDFSAERYVQDINNLYQELIQTYLVSH